MGAAGTVLPYGHRPRQPLRYASPLPAPCGRPTPTPGDEGGPPHPQEEEARLGHPTFGGAVDNDGLPGLALVAVFGQDLSPLGSGLFPMMRGLAGTRPPAVPSSLRLHPKEAAWAAFGSPRREPPSALRLQQDPCQV